MYDIMFKPIKNNYPKLHQHDLKVKNITKMITYHYEDGILIAPLARPEMPHTSQGDTMWAMYVVEGLSQVGNKFYGKNTYSKHPIFMHKNGRLIQVLTTVAGNGAGASAGLYCIEEVKKHVKFHPVEGWDKYEYRKLVFWSDRVEFAAVANSLKIKSTVTQNPESIAAILGHGNAKLVEVGKPNLVKTSFSKVSSAKYSLHQFTNGLLLLLNRCDGCLGFGTVQPNDKVP